MWHVTCDLEVDMDMGIGLRVVLGWWVLARAARQRRGG